MGLRVICVVPLTIIEGSPDGVDLDHVVNVVALDLPGNARERNEIVGHDDDAVGIDGIGEGNSQRTACRRSVRAIGVAEEVGCGRGNRFCGRPAQCRLHERQAERAAGYFPPARRQHHRYRGPHSRHAAAVEGRHSTVHRHARRNGSVDQFGEFVSHYCD